MSFEKIHKYKIYRTGVVTDCGRWLIAKFSKECRDNLVYFAKLNAKEEITGKLPFTKIIKKLESDYEYIGNFETKAIFKTNKNAPNYKLISIDLENFKDDPSTWSDLIPEHSQNVLDWAAPINGDKLVLCYLEDVKVCLCFIKFFALKLINYCLFICRTC